MKPNRSLSEWVWNNIHIDDMQKTLLVPRIRGQEEIIARLEERVAEMTGAVTRYFLTIDWCDKGNRGVFSHRDGKTFNQDVPHTEEEMLTILGPFCFILNPQSTPFTEKELAEYQEFHPLEEYSYQYGYVVKKAEDDGDV